MPLMLWTPWNPKDQLRLILSPLTLEEDVPMSDGHAEPDPKAPSFKDKLLNTDTQILDDEEEDLVLQQGDVSIGLNGNVPTVNFASHVLETLNQKMGPAIETPKLPAQYYHKSIIRSIGSVFGEVIKVDYNTDSGDRGKFARLAVSIDLTKPLISKIQVDGETIFVEYEGLPTICFHCGRYGHLQASCPELMAPDAASTPAASNIMPTQAPMLNPAKTARESEKFGVWMVVQRKPRRTTEKVVRNNTPHDGRIVASTTRYEVLQEVNQSKGEHRETHVRTNNNLFHREEGNYHKKKGKETKGIQKALQGTSRKYIG
ncbi:hypothetical protein K1719_026173 [Acacia pycnantha]|nr:hypothetical protein K1719_026173 [Acacia pycnantha]